MLEQFAKVLDWATKALAGKCCESGNGVVWVTLF